MGICTSLQSCTPGFRSEMSHYRQAAKIEQGEGDMQELGMIENNTPCSSLDDMQGGWSEESCSTSDQNSQKLIRKGLPHSV